MKSIIASGLPLLCLFAGIPAFSATQISRAALQKQDIVLLERVEETANNIWTTTERIDSYNRVPNEYSRECHMLQLEALKEETNGMTRDLERLAATRDGLEEADRRAVERVLITAMELAQSVNTAIVKAGQAGTSPALNVEYRKLVADCYREAGLLVKALDAGRVELK